MNENHARHLLTTFRHIDNLLSEAEHIMATAGGGSPFAEYTQDTTPVQRKVYTTTLSGYARRWARR